MPIEFHCSSCQQFLRVPDDAAGKKAKCPKCQEVLTVPSAAVPPVFPPLPSASAPPPPKPDPYAAGPSPYGSASYGGGPAPNPYASPLAESKEQMPIGDIRPGTFDVGDIFNIAFETYKANFGLCLGASLLMLVVGVVFGGVTGAINGIVQVAARDTPAVVIVAQLVTQIAQQLFQMYIGAGGAIFFLALTRRQRPEIGLLFSGLRCLGSLVLFNLILYGGIVLLALILLIPAVVARQQELMLLAVIAIFPAIYVMLTYGFGMFLIIDRNMSALDAIKTSALITPGNRLKFILMGLLMLALYIAGLLACIIGVIFVIPLFHLMPVLAYRAMIGENVRATA